MTGALLQASALERSFGAVRALDHVDLEIAAGELLGIIGPNGSGKTTLFNCLTGRLHPEKGQVIFGGRAIKGLPMRKVARLGLLRTFQESRFFPSASTADNVEMVRSLGSRHASSRATPWTTTSGILDLMRLTEVADAPARVVPFGQQRRLGIAMCLAMRPSLLLLDEPAAGLNAAEGAELARCLASIREAGITLGVVDHDMDFLLPLVDRLVVLAEGRNIAAGPPNEVRTDSRVIDVYLGHRRESQPSGTGSEP